MHPSERRRRLIEGLELPEHVGFLVTSATNVGYLTGFGGDDSALVLTEGRAIVVSDGRFEVQLADECPDVEAVIRPIGVPLHAAIGDLGRRLGLKTLDFEGVATTVDHLETLRVAAEGIELRPTSWGEARRRGIKDAGEVAAIVRAIRVAERAFRDLHGWMSVGSTEKEAADVLESALRRHGASSASFPPIVAAGRRSALPHARPSEASAVERDSSILVDWGATRDGYKSDLTRVLTTGIVSRDFERAHAAVLEAQRLAIAAIGPGVEARAVDAAARRFLEAEGYGPAFNHSVGHGIGRDVHEAPILRGVVDTPLEAGMVVTVEPGVYFADWGGIRIEDDVLVTESGREVLSTLPRSIEANAV